MPRRHGTDGHHACGKAQDMRLEAKGIEKWYFRRRGDSNRFYAVRKCDLTLLPGTLTVLTGRSGSGKTTLLHMLSGILTPDDGTVLADDLDLYAMDDRSLSAFRNAHIGMLPQGGDVLPDLTVMENILLPHGIRLAQKGKDAEDRAHVFQHARRHCVRGGIAAGRRSPARAYRPRALADFRWMRPRVVRSRGRP